MAEPAARAAAARRAIFHRTSKGTIKMTKFENDLPASDGRYKAAARHLRKAWEAMPPDANLNNVEQRALFLGMMPHVFGDDTLDKLLTAVAVLATRSRNDGKPTVVSTLLDANTGACRVYHDPDVQRSDIDLRKMN